MKTVCWCQTAHHIQYVHLKTTEGQTATLSNVEQNIFWMRWDLKGTELKAIYSKVFVLSLTFTKETEAHLHLQTTSSFLKYIYFSPAYLLHICHHCFTWSTFCAIKKYKHVSAHNVAEWLNIDVAILW